MKIDGSWEPESDEEIALIKKLHEVRAEAYAMDVEPSAIASAFAFMSAISYAHQPEDGKPPESLKQRIEREQEKARNCPECGNEIKDVTSLGIGGALRVMPCGHEFSWDEEEKLRMWIEDPTEKS